MRNWGSLAALGFKLLGVIAKLAKSLKVVKVGLGVASAAAYAWLFSPEFAAVILVSLVIHEYGHLRAMKSCGIPTKGIFLIPFVGGAAVAEKGFASRADESYVAMMGPVWGLMSAVVPGLLYLVYPAPILAGIAAFVALTNIFNLLPVNPLDGGRVIKSIAFSFGSRAGLAVMLLGLVATFAGMLFLKIGLFLLIGLIATFEILAEWSTFQRQKTNNLAAARADIDEAKEHLNVYGTLPPGITQEMYDRGLELYHEWTKPVMRPTQIAVHSVAYLGLLASFLTVIHLASTVPGADIALKALVEHHE